MAPSEKARSSFNPSYKMLDFFSGAKSEEINYFRCLRLFLSCIMVRCNLIPVCSDKVATHGVEFSHLSRNVFQIRHAFFVIFAMESSKSDTDTEQNFQRPSEPGPSFRAPEAVRSRGGKRRGSVKKRKHEEGYENVRSSLWKTISLHANVYEEWMALRTAHNFKENSAFAQFLLKRAANAATDAEMTFRSDISTQAAGLER